MTDDKYLATQQIRVLQQQAEADPAIAELVVAYTRLRTDAGLPLDFYTDSAAEDLDDMPANRKLVFNDWLERNPDLDPRVRQFFVCYGRELLRRRVPVIFSRDHLAFKLGISVRQLNWLAHASSGRYRTFTIPKRNGAARVIQDPHPKLKTVQGWILNRILYKQEPHKYAAAFYPGRSIRQAAFPHARQSVVARVDLKDFFPSIPHSRVRRVFQKFGYTYSVASCLANLCCMDGKLPQGAPTSPAISNLVALNLDRRMAALKKKLKFRYSRYADDIILSSNREAFPKLLPFLKQVITEEHFVINEEKVRVMSQGTRQTVTGLVVNQGVNISRERLRLLRTVLHDAKRRGVTAACMRWNEVHGTALTEFQFTACLRGQVAFVLSINPLAGARLKAACDSVLSQA